MSKVERHIRELLEENECVIVPKMGAILSIPSNSGPGTFKLSSGPGSMKFSFNDLLKYNDGLLANHIVKQDKISYHEALAEIEKFVADVNKEIEENRTFTIEQVGELYRDEENVIQLAPLSDITTVKEAASLTESLSNYISDDAEQLEKQIETTESLSPIVVEQKSTGKKKNVIFILSLFLAGNILAYCFFIYFSGRIVSNTADVSTANESISPAIENVKPVTTAPEATVVNNNQSPVEKEKTEIVNTPAAQIPTPSESQKSDVLSESRIGGSSANKSQEEYYIVAGSFKSNENSKRKLGELNRAGFKNALIYSRGDGKFLVCFDRFETLNAAQDFLNKLNGQNKNAWIFNNTEAASQSKK